MAVQIPLGGGGFTLVDDEDAEEVLGRRWVRVETKAGAYATHYFRYDGKVNAIKLHRFLLMPAAGFVVDHINHDGLDNRRENLRVISQKENLQNRRGANSRSSTGVLNVQLRAGGRYLVILRLNGRQTLIGTFRTLEDAARVAAEARARLLPFSAEARQGKETP